MANKLGRVRVGLYKWAQSLKSQNDGAEKELRYKLESLMAKDRDDFVLEDLINTKVSLNLEIDKNEFFWEQMTHANWL